MLGPALRSVAETDLKPVPLSVTWISTGATPSTSTLGENGDLRRHGFEAWPQVVSTAGDGDYNDQDEDDNDGELAARSIGRKSAHSVLQVVGREHRLGEPPAGGE